MGRAMDEYVVVAPGVKRNDCHWGYYLQGRKDDLIASGLVKAEWLPDESVRDKRGRVIRSRKTMLADGMEVRATQTKLRFCVHFEYSDEEKERRHAIEEYKKAKQAEAKELSHLPQSHEQYRNRYVGFFEALYEDRFSELFGESKYHGYRYAPEVIQACEVKLQEIRELLETGRTLYSAERQQAYIAKVKASTAAADPEFHGFLTSITNRPQSES